MTRSLFTRACRLGILVALLLSSTAVAQRGSDSPPPASRAGEPLVEVAPIRCWWRASTGAVTIGEQFDVRLTCAVLENDSVQVVPDEARLTVAGVQLPPFEIVGGDHPADTRAGDRRFFQYRYTLRLVNPDEIGQDVSLPRLPVTYKVQSRVAANARLAGRDFTYLMPGLSLRVVSMVPEDAADIRDGADVGLERVETLLLRARVADIGALAFLGAGLLMAVLALVAVRERARPVGARERARVSDGRVLSATRTELARIGREAAGGWTPELIGGAHAGLRIVGAMALGRPVTEQPLPSGAQADDGRIGIPAMLPWRAGVSVTSATTTADVETALAALPSGASVHERAGLEALRDALGAFTAARYAATETAPDQQTLTSAFDAGRSEAVRLSHARRWTWLRRLSSPRRWWKGAGAS